MEIVYATQRVPEVTGRRFINAQFFLRPEPGATRVFVDSAFPAIAEAYRAIGVPVVMIGKGYRASLPEPPPVVVARVLRKPADEMDNAELRAAIADTTGKAPGVRTGRAKLLAMYSETHVG
ncbi:hypothetical protein APY04_0826 [Hyphomicrobium sulfonivorans]|uniref:Uncharacterized protein n=1 Tax=Hyphomicrobium sulfonivorans TaxID=121290 RepID=A0A120CXC7_HYPSL|nr:hypothetical protein [Hyphomicrobium sulfonivorans]KWT70765.1 hypothetical protein APY04_0826 [Hyphomicrobium sulfonivorans]